MSDNTNKIPLTYKGRPLIRKDNTIYYGYMSDKYIAVLQVLSTKKVGDLDVAEKVSVQLQLTDPDISAKDKIIKSSTKDGLYNAMDIALNHLKIITNRLLRTFYPILPHRPFRFIFPGGNTHGFLQSY